MKNIGGIIRLVFVKLGGECRWRRVPDLPEPVNRFHKVIGFCSTIPIQRILGSEVV